MKWSNLCVFIGWPFVCGIAFACLFLDPPFRDMYLKFLGFVAIVFAPLIWKISK